MHQNFLLNDDHQQIENLIIQSAQASNEIQKSVYTQIQELNQKPIFLNHLVELYRDQSKSKEFKYRTGILLKSAIRQINIVSIPSENMNHIQNILLECMRDDQDNKKVTSLLVSTLLTHAGIQKCYLLLQNLIESLDSKQNLNLAVDCLSKMIEDLKYNQENISFYDTTEGIRLMDSLIVKFLQILQSQEIQQNQMGFLRSCEIFKIYKDEQQTFLSMTTVIHDEEVLSNAINFLNFNVFFMPPSLSQNCKHYLDILILCTFFRSTIFIDSRSSVKQLRLRSLQGFQVLVETKRDYMNDHMTEIIQVTCSLTNDPDKQVKKESMIFLTDFLRIDDDDFLWQLELLKAQLQMYTNVLYGSVIPKIVECLQITQDDIINIMPTFDTQFKPKDELRDDEDDLNECTKGEYTVRKVAGQLIEKICDYFPEEGYRILSQILEPLILSQNWKLQESSFLCFGTVASSLLVLLTPGLPKLMEYLFQATKASSLHLRSTAIWTIAQFTTWVQEIAPKEQNFIIKYLELLLVSLDDPEKVVQESACSALNKLASEASSIIQPFLEQILDVYMKALSKEDGGIAIFIYGSLTAVVQNSENIKNPYFYNNNILKSKYAQLLLSRLVNKLEAYKEDDQNICPILECISIMVEKFEELSNPYCQAIFNKCFTCIQIYIKALQNNELKLLQEKKQIYMRCLDLLSQIVYVIRDDFKMFIVNTNLIDSILISLQDTETDVKQYAVSFLGELVKSCPQGVPLYIENIILNLCQNVYDLDNDPLKSFLSLTNNSVWSLAEISLQYPEKLINTQEQLIKKIIQLLHTPKLHRHIAQNFAVALTRFCALKLDTGAVYLGSFFKRICLVLAEAKSDEFKDHKNESFKVLFQLILLNPQAALPHMVYLLYSFTLFEQSSLDNQQQFKKVTSDYKASIPTQEWEQQLTSQVFPAGFRAKLLSRFNF